MANILSLTHDVGKELQERVGVILSILDSVTSLRLQQALVAWIHQIWILRVGATYMYRTSESQMWMLGAVRSQYLHTPCWHRACPTHPRTIRIHCIHIQSLPRLSPYNACTPEQMNEAFEQTESTVCLTIYQYVHY